MYTEKQIQQYLKRIDYKGGLAPNLENLTALHRQHLLHIPYENLDILNGVPLSLVSGDLFEKIIVNRRGGYCFELQGLFYSLLRSLGYSVTQYAGRFMNRPGVVQMRRHRILTVDLDGKRWVCDVGVRTESFRCPLELTEGLVQEDGISRYCYRRDPFYGWVLMQRKTGKDWKPVLGFTEEVQVDEDYVMPSFYCEKHPDSIFNKSMKISLFTEDGTRTVLGNTFRVCRRAKVVEQRELKTNEEAVSLLKEAFGIAVPETYRHFLTKGEQEEI